jgi:hypothetical protein
MRVAIVDGTAPHPWDLAGGGLLLVPAVIVVASVGLGYYVFNRQAPRIAEEL